MGCKETRETINKITQSICVCMQCISMQCIMGCSVECHSSLIPRVCCFSTVAVCLRNMAHHTERRLRINICLCAVCIHIWPPVSAIWIMLCCLWCEICYGNGSCDRDIHSMRVCSFGSASFFLACSCISRAQGFTVHWVTGQAHFPCAFHT